MWLDDSTVAYLIVKEEKAAKKTKEVCRQQSQVDSGGTSHLHHDGHEAVQRKHAQDVDDKQHG